MTARKNTKVTPIEEVIVEEPATTVTYSPKDLALELNTDAKSFRRWLRTQTTDRANKGGRWVFDAESKAAFIAAYNTRSTKGTLAKLPETTDAN